MDYPHIALHLGNENAIHWPDDFTGLRDSVLNSALQQCQQVQASLEQEMRNRRISAAPQQDENCKTHYERLRKMAESLKVLERLDVRALKHVRTARDCLETEQTNRGFQVYRDFLQDIMRHCGPEMVLLSAISFGKQRIASMTIADRTALIRNIKEDGSTVLSPVLTRLAEEHGLSNKDGSHKRAHLQDTEPRQDQRGRELTANRQEKDQLGISRRIEYTYSHGPVHTISILGDLFADAVRDSHQWKWERVLAVGTATDCITALVPENRSLDIAINVLVGWEKGTQLIENLELMPEKISQ